MRLALPNLLSGCHGRLFRLHALEAHGVLAAVAVHAHAIAGQNSTLENLHRQWILDQTLDGAAQRASPVSRIVALAQDELRGPGRNLQRDLTLGEKAFHIPQQEVNDALELFRAERVE